MEQKLVRVPFDVELAKKITNKEIEGKIVTRNGVNVRIVCFDVKNNYYPIVAIMADENGEETVITRTIDGKIVPSATDTDQGNLMLEIPEYLTFKDGDILSYEVGTFILKKIDGKDRVEYYVSLYEKYVAFDSACLMKNLVNHLRLATGQEKQKLIDVLKASKDPRVKEYLKRFFGIEEKKKCEFNPKDWVLCYSDGWNLCQFSHTKLRDLDNKLMYVTVGGIAYEKCIPYNEQTAHLLGTTDDWEG